MAFFKRELGPVERFESALLARQDERRKLAARLDLTEKLLAERRATAEKLAVSGASAAKLGRAEAKMREVEERARTLRTELADLDAQIVATERALADARAQRDRELAADQIEALAAAIERAGPGFGAGAAALVEAVTRGPATVREATKFAASVDAIRREVMSATDLICWELRTIAVRTRAGNANATPAAPTEAEHTVPIEIERQRIYTLNPLLWREGSEVCKAPAFTMVGLPKVLLAVALRRQHVDYLNARRVQTLMHVHGNAQGDLPDDAALIDLDALAAEEQNAKVNVA
jgi:Trp operon repressor